MNQREIEIARKAFEAGYKHGGDTVLKYGFLGTEQVGGA